MNSYRQMGWSSPLTNLEVLPTFPGSGENMRFQLCHSRDRNALNLLRLTTFCCLLRHYLIFRSSREDRVTRIQSGALHRRQCPICGPIDTQRHHGKPREVYS